MTDKEKEKRDLESGDNPEEREKSSGTTESEKKRRKNVIWNRAITLKNVNALLISNNKETPGKAFAPPGFRIG